MGKVRACFVPEILTQGQKSNRKECCKELGATAEQESNILKNVVAGDETCYLQYYPKTKRQIAQWEDSSRPYRRKHECQSWK